MPIGLLGGQSGGGGGGTGDETLVPHTDLRVGPLRMYIVRKLHNTGIRLYCLADATSRYIVDVYLLIN